MPEYYNNPSTHDQNPAFRGYDPYIGRYLCPFNLTQLADILKLSPILILRVKLTCISTEWKDRTQVPTDLLFN